MTLLLDISPEAQVYFDTLRKQYFPSHKMRDNAHITLLYQIHEPPQKIIERLSGIHIAPFEIQVSGITPFPHGNAIQLQSDPLQSLHQDLKRLFKGKTSKRDLVKYRPHITVQLHVTAFKAQRTLTELQQEVSTFRFMATGMSLWKKHSPPFEKVWAYAFEA